ncbi:MULTISPECIES: formimidoylglutamase [unclassified Pseudoalteromonas]|uniref:formimidoylglutamase n=1 Tax=unclassified Pseudoalteromonas TaxID=194690 RepID=UPI0030151DE0
MNSAVKIYDEHAISELTVSRDGETRLWQSISFLQSQDNFLEALKDAAAFGIRYVLVGIPEDIGPRANCGKGGSELGWQAFLKRFLNQPENQFLSAKKVLLLGEVELDDINAEASSLDNTQPQQLQRLRQLCASIDQRVIAVFAAIFAAGLEPIVIGGGHNNAYGLLQGYFQATQSPLAALNFDPHADFRACEGRHSGNGFSYAHQAGSLADYHIIGLHEQKNNQAILTRLHDVGFGFTSYQDIYVRRVKSLTEAVTAALASYHATTGLGVELDVDAITAMPASALTYQGFSAADAEHFVYLASQHKNSKYLHLCEAAPSRHPHGEAVGIEHCGQVLANLVNAYLSAKLG